MLGVAGVASLFIVVSSQLVFLFATATGCCSDHDFQKSIFVGGLSLSTGCGVTVGWLLYGLRHRRPIRFVLTAPVALVALFGLTSALAILLGWKPAFPDP